MMLALLDTDLFFDVINYKELDQSKLFFASYIGFRALFAVILFMVIMVILTGLIKYLIQFQHFMNMP